MEKIYHLKHSKETLFFCISRLLEKTSFYGLRSILLLYMVTGALKIPEANASTIYVWFASSFIVSQIIGALFGDLLLGNKKAIIIGGIIQALGAFILCIPSTIGLYTGLSLVVIGNGLFSSNLIANFGKSYLNKSKLLDSGFSILHFTVNIGAFLGAVFLTFIATKFNFNSAFIIVGFLILLSTIPIIFTTENESVSINQNTISIGKSSLLIVVLLLLIGLYWLVNDILEIKNSFLQVNLVSNYTSSFFLYYGHLGFSLVFSIIAIIIWRYYYTSSFLKFTIGFILSLISASILFFIPQESGKNYLFLIIIFQILNGISEIFISPVSLSILTKYSNPKYLATFFSLTMVPFKIFTFLFFWNSVKFNSKSTLEMNTVIVTLIVVTMGLIFFLIINKNKKIFTD